MDRATTPIGQALAGLSGLALILIMLLFAWFSVPEAGGLDAFKSFHDWVLLILIFTAFAGMAVGLMGSEPLGLPVALSAITTALGAVAVVVLFVYLISPPGFPLGDLGEVELDRGIGIWLGLISVAGIFVGGFLSMQEEGITLADQADGLRGDGPTPGPPQAAPQPPPAAPQPPESPPPPPPQSTPPPPPPSTPPPGGGP
jgi:hypothetical protein